MTAIIDAAMRRFESWADYNSAVGEEFRCDPRREPWPVEYENAGTGIDNDRWPRPELVRILFLPHGFALDSSRDGALGNLVACGMAWEPPVTLLAERLPFRVAKSLITQRPGTLKGAIEVLRDASDSGP
ncbi:MAG: hypothetical protein ACRDPY_41800 [Streptosporangiaceae bacterium]